MKFFLIFFFLLVGWHFLYRVFARMQNAKRYVKDFESGAKDLKLLEGKIFESGNKERIILLIHGLSTSPEEWEPLLHSLKQKNISFRAPLLLGHGRKNTDAFSLSSEEIWFKQISEIYENLALHYKKIDLVGYSNGGLLACKLAEKYKNSKQVGKVILINPFIYPAAYLRFIFKISAFAPIKWFLYFFVPYVPMDIFLERKVYQYPYLPFSALLSIGFFQQNFEPSLRTFEAEEGIYLIYGGQDRLANYKQLLTNYLSKNPFFKKAFLFKEVDHRILENAQIEDELRSLFLKLIMMDGKAEE